MPNILGLSAYFHDSACCLLKDGVLVAAAQEERFSHRKHDPSVPKMAFRYCLSEGNLSINDIDCIAYYENPAKKLDRQLWMILPSISEATAFDVWRKAKRPAHDIRKILGFDGPIQIFDHHQAHAASSYFFSGFPDAAVLTVDGVGEWATTTYGHAQANTINLMEEVHFPDSIGLLYSAITSYLGFAVNDGEYKVMGLAPYGKPVYVDRIRQLVQPLARGQFSLNLDYFDFGGKERMYTDALPKLFGEPPREKESQITIFHKDVARSLQVVLEETLIEKAKYLYEKTGSENLCMAGGVALNCVANARILNESPFKRLFVQPAAGDAGTCLGAAVLAHVNLTGSRPSPERLEHVYLGPRFTLDEIAKLIQETNVTAADFRGREESLLAHAVELLAAGKVIGWFEGRMEFGPRALGARSILADPRDSGMRDRINAVVKKREGFRPFAPVVLESKAPEHFDLDHASPFMLETCQVKSKLDLPAITHVDNSARVQTINESVNSRLARLLKAFDERTGCPILLNTSFNMRDEPIVCSPSDAIWCFARTDIDALFLEDFVIDRNGLGSWEELRSSVTAKTKTPSLVSDRIYTMM
jgi:carbamoyltransferase